MFLNSPLQCTILPGTILTSFAMEYYRTVKRAATVQLLCDWKSLQYSTIGRDLVLCCLSVQTLAMVYCIMDCSTWRMNPSRTDPNLAFGVAEIQPPGPRAN